MEFILWNRENFDKIYNCTGINVDDIPIEKRRYPITAIICILLGFIYYPLYFPRLYFFWKNRSKNPCYILLIYLSLMDICILWVPTFAVGIFSLNFQSNFSLGLPKFSKFLPAALEMEENWLLGLPKFLKFLPAAQRNGLNLAS
ncbi:unnamed protein product [Meloidogyne enterolobii]|uniref:Uncharacterized protein n=1 Tax=Meloidogyne enterolobii TaxID=390850 RepID=A0ACB0YM68_MELEN